MHGTEPFEPKCPANLNGKWPYCPECGSDVNPMEIDYCVKKCSGPGLHTIGPNGQLWIPEVHKFCYVYGLNKEDIERKRKENESKTQEVVEG